MVVTGKIEDTREVYEDEWRRGRSKKNGWIVRDDIREKVGQGRKCMKSNIPSYIDHHITVGLR